MTLRPLTIARLKRWLIPLGWTLVVLALALVIQRLITGGGMAVLLERPEALWTILPAALIYGISCAILAAAWWALLKPLDPGGLRFPSAHRIYALSQIGKYLPGNVMHFVGRAAMARAEGVQVTRTGFTMVQESMLMMTAAFALAAALGGTRWLGLPSELTIPAVIAMVLAALALSSAPGIAARFGLGAGGEGAHIGGELRRLAWAGCALLGYGLFFCIAGLIFLAILRSLNAAAPMELAIAAVCAGWLLGFVTPGASAGIGVREAVLIAALEPAAGPAAAAAALLFRLVTTGGDLVLFASGAAVRRWAPPQGRERSAAESPDERR
jgi:glycosyltransferase 2 family protein